MPIRSATTYYTASPIPSILSSSALRETASWIRDVLDPAVAREGSGQLQPDDVLTLHNLLIALRQYSVPLSTIRYSRIHLAVSEICGKATRWPAKLCDEADLVVQELEAAFGPLRNIPVLLFEKGGRLWNICGQTQLSNSALYSCFESDSPSNVDSARAYFSGGVDFTAGRWWINAMFAFRDGIIDAASINGGITYDAHGAYAIVLRSDEEINAPTPHSFTYRCKQNDPGIWRLTMPQPREKTRVRVLRSHALSSLWAPVAGIRYDGVYKVTGYTWLRTTPSALSTNPLTFKFHVHLERIDKTPIGVTLSRPRADELDDYRAYKLAVRDHREAERVRCEMELSLASRAAAGGRVTDSGDTDSSGTPEVLRVIGELATLRPFGVVVDGRERRVGFGAGGARRGSVVASASLLGRTMPITAETTYYDGADWEMNDAAEVKIGHMEEFGELDAEFYSQGRFRVVDWRKG